MTASKLRKENYALFNYIKYEVLPVEFSEQKIEDPLVYNSSGNYYYVDPEYLYEPSPISNGRGWVIFDDIEVNGVSYVDTAQEQSSKVSVVGASSYTIDYVNGRIYNPDSVPTSVTYYWNYVAVVDGWPGVTPPPIPVVAIDIDRFSEEGFQLGAGKKTEREVYLHIFGASKADRDDLTQFLYDALFNKNIVIKDFTQGNYINYDGTYNTGFVPSIDTDSTYMYVTDIYAKNINNYADWSEINRWRSLISFSYETYKES